MNRDPIDHLETSLKRQRAIVHSRIREIWTPHRPIFSIDLFAGRPREIEAIVDAAETPGQHAILFGDRGVGKSSLANIARVLVESFFQRKTYLIRCDSTTTFASIAADIVKDLEIPLVRRDVTDTKRTQAHGSVGIPILGAGTEAELIHTVTEEAEAIRWSPSTICRSLQGRKAFIVIDEIDVLRSRDDRHQVAELIKQLSDSGTEVKLLVVGIGTTTAGLLAGHPSVHRNLKEVHLGRMTNREVRNLIATNTGRTKHSFAPAVVSEIVRLSDGFPYFTQLLGLKCSELAVANNRRSVFPSDLPQALHGAVEDAEETLTTEYGDAVRSHETQMYEWILKAAASTETMEVSAKHLRDEISKMAGRTVLQRDLNNAFTRLVRPDGTGILKRLSRGIYRFSDPRMKVYVRMVSKVGELT